MTRTNTYLRELPPGLTHIDVYWVLRLFNVTDPCVQHAVKKLLADGSGDKDRDMNIEEAWETLDRWREMQRHGPFDDEADDTQRPPGRPADDRPTIHNCPSGAVCRNDCGLERCKLESA